MRAVVGFLAAALLLAVVGVVCVGVSRLEARLADAHEQASTLQFERAQESIAAARVYLPYADWVPRLGDRVRREIRVREAMLQYWQRKYDVLVADQAPAEEDEPLIDVQLVVANAAFRAGRARASTRTAATEALDEAVARYAAVLRNAEWRRDAAYNYEYTVRLRDEIAKGRRPPSAPAGEETDLGLQGGASAATRERFEIYVPRENEERTPAPAGGDAAKVPPGARKG